MLSPAVYTAMASNESRNLNAESCEIKENPDASSTLASPELSVCNSCFTYTCLFIFLCIVISISLIIQLHSPINHHHLTAPRQTWEGDFLVILQPPFQLRWSSTWLMWSNQGSSAYNRTVTKLCTRNCQHYS